MKPRLSPDLCAWLVALAAAATASAAPPRARAIMLVDNSVFSHVRAGLETYAQHVLREHNILCVPLPDDYYAMPPAAIRSILRRAHELPGDADTPPLVGAIMVGPIPHACRSHDPNEILIPSPLFYEDFDAQWIDSDGDGVFESLLTDRATNPTEIWTAWWVPPALDRAAQTRLLALFLDKLDRYYKGGIVGRDQMLWTAGNVVKVEDVEGWTVLLKETMQPLEQKLQIWSRIGEDPGTHRPSKRKSEFGPRDFLTAFSLQPWQHCHISAHGNARGWYWDNTGVVASRAADHSAEWTLLMDLDTFAGTAGNIVTTSGCSNGNFRGDYVKEAYDKSIGNLLLFSPHTCTIAYYGAASPQSTSGFACYCTELIESLRADGGSYLAEGYFKMRNHDYSWGTQHYFFRGGDEKILCGDPFARYRDSRPDPDVEAAAREKVERADWITLE